MAISSSNVERPSWSPVRKRSESTVAFLDLHFIECTICLDTLTSHIFHCDNGHLVCSPCFEMLSQKCATCSLPIVSRNLSMESLIEKLKYPCPNAQFGCPDGVTDGERSKHIEEYCDFVQRPCSFPSCDFTGSYNDLKQHMDVKHTTCKVQVENSQEVHKQTNGKRKRGSLDSNAQKRSKTTHNETHEDKQMRSERKMQHKRKTLEKKKKKKHVKKVSRPCKIFSRMQSLAGT
ncbi:unnamed protein product [Cochlearia groenlandica]